MRLIADAVEDLPAECRDLAGNALLNIAAEAVAQDVGGSASVSRETFGIIDGHQRPAGSSA